MNKALAGLVVALTRRLREANERINTAAGVYDVDMPVPFICECADPTCSEVVRLELSEYEEIRADPRHFLNVPGHQAAAGEAAVVVKELDTYLIAEKTGHAGDIAEALDERHGTGQLGSEEQIG